MINESRMMKRAKSGGLQACSRSQIFIKYLYSSRYIYPVVNILIIDDEENLRKLLARVIERESCSRPS